MPGHPARILRHSSVGKAHAKNRVVLLFGESWDRISQWSIVAIDEIRKELYDRGFYLDTVASLFWKKNPEGLLERLLDQHDAHCWILAGVPFSVQYWFQERNLNAVVMGNAFSEIRYPFVNDDLSGVTRHAAGTFLGLGHRDIVFFMRKLGSAGEMAEERGFMEAFRTVKDASCRVVTHTGGVNEIRSALQRVFMAKKKTDGGVGLPCYGCVGGGNLVFGKGNPSSPDVSLISFQWESCLDAVRPLPAYYKSDPKEHARKLCRLAIAPWHKKKSPSLIIPNFFKNGTVAPPMEA